MGRSRRVTYFLAAGSASIAFLMIRYPEIAVKASFQGLQLWWENVFPALFPFFVLSELMIGFGVVTFAGVLLEPVMRPLFRVPGIGGFVFMMGLVSGFPAGARMTAQLYKDNKLSKTEAERLSSFTNFSNPLFLFSVAAVQFFHQAALGIVFALAHYIGNIGTGMLMRFYRHDRTVSGGKKLSLSLFVDALKSMHRERVTRYEPFGKMLGDAVISSVRTLLAIGGFIALFSMLYQLFDQIGIIGAFGKVLSRLLSLSGFDPILGHAVVPGIFELTIGIHEIGAAPAPMEERVIFVCALLGFCGFSIQAQAVSIISQAGLSTKPFIVGRLIQAAVSGVAGLFLYNFLHMDAKLQAEPAFSAVNSFYRLPGFTTHAGSMITACILILFVCLLLKRMTSDPSSDGH